MHTYGYARWIAIFACAITVACLGACSKEHALEQKRAAAQTVATARNLAQMKKILALKLQIKQASDRSAKDNQQIPTVLAQSDVALKQAQKLQAQAAQTKNPKARKLADARARQAQDQADSKAQQLVALRQDYYAQLAAITDLQNQINGLSGKDKAASQVAVSQDNSGHKKHRPKHTSKIADDSTKSHM
jgi:hypothetical protein